MQKILAWAGLSGEGEYIGSGTMGNAYRFGDKILKLTKDISEAYASHMIMGKEQFFLPFEQLGFGELSLIYALKLGVEICACYGQAGPE
jgi:hypothetical protein